MTSSSQRAGVTDAVTGAAGDAAGLQLGAAAGNSTVDDVPISSSVAQVNYSEVEVCSLN